MTFLRSSSFLSICPTYLNSSSHTQPATERQHCLKDSNGGHGRRQELRRLKLINYSYLLSHYIWQCRRSLSRSMLSLLKAMFIWKLEDLPSLGANISGIHLNIVINIKANIRKPVSFHVSAFTRAYHCITYSSFPPTHIPAALTRVQSYVRTQLWCSLSCFAFLQLLQARTLAPPCLPEVNAGGNQARRESTSHMKWRLRKRGQSHGFKSVVLLFLKTRPLKHASLF